MCYLVFQIIIENYAITYNNGEARFIQPKVLDRTSEKHLYILLLIGTMNLL